LIGWNLFKTHTRFSSYAMQRRIAKHLYSGNPTQDVVTTEEKISSLPVFAGLD
jgi:hypothetical protein